MTVAVIPILKSHGVDTISVGANGASTPPNVPPFFRWVGPTPNPSQLFRLRATCPFLAEEGEVLRSDDVCSGSPTRERKLESFTTGEAMEEVHASQRLHSSGKGGQSRTHYFSHHTPSPPCHSECSHNATRHHATARYRGCHRIRLARRQQRSPTFPPTLFYPSRTPHA